MKHILNVGLFLLVLAMCVVLWSIKIEYSL